jgi:DNA replication protein DnaC
LPYRSPFLIVSAIKQVSCPNIGDHYRLLAAFYENRSVIITSNLPFSGWEKLFKDPMTTAAAIDRLVHHSIIIELNLSSYRLNTANTRKMEALEKNN